MTNLPNCIIAGTAKSGTTLLASLISKHKDLFIPAMKEMRFFSQMPTNHIGGYASEYANGGIRNLSLYKEAFDSGKEKYSFDISNDYFFHFEESIKNIKKFYGQTEPKILIILRNPVDRIFSMYNHILRLGGSNYSFYEHYNLSKEFNMHFPNYAWNYNLHDLGMSFEACKSFKDNFSDVGIFFYEDTIQKGDLGKIEDFIGFKLKDKLGDKVNENHYKEPKFKLLLKFKYHFIEKHKKTLKKIFPKFILASFSSLLSKLEKINVSKKDVFVSDEAKMEVFKDYTNDIEKLEQLLNCKVPWRSK